MTTTPIVLRLRQGDTHPVLTWTIQDELGAAENLTAATKTVELYLYEATAAPGAAALWKIVLTKSATPTDGKVKFTADSTHPFYPAALITAGGGHRKLRGDLRFKDTAAAIPVDKWIMDALRVSIDQAPAEPV